jgi:hypothetical protein
MICVSPLSPSFCEVGAIVIVVTNWVDGETSNVVAYSIDFIDSIWANTYYAFCFVEFTLQIMMYYLIIHNLYI